MSLNASEVSVAISGAVGMLLSDIEITSATQVIPAEDIVDLGYIAEAGVSISSSMDTTDTKAWQHANIVRTTITGGGEVFKFTLLQNSKATREFFYGTTEVNGRIEYAPTKTTRGRFIIDFIDNAYGENGEILHGRHVIDRGMVVSRGDIVLSNSGDPIGFEVEVRAYPNDKGVTSTKFHSVDTTEETVPVED